MFFFDIIFERLNPDVVDSFNEVLNKYRSAIETFITKPAIYSESYIEKKKKKSSLYHHK